MIRCLLNFAFHGDRWSGEFHSRKCREKICCLRLVNSVKSYQDSSIHPVGVQRQDWQMPGRASFLRTAWRTRKVTPAGLRNKEPCQRPFTETRAQTRVAVPKWWRASDLRLQKVWDAAKDDHVGAQLWGLKNLGKLTRARQKFWS